MAKEKVPSYVIDHVQRAINAAQMETAIFSQDTAENERIKNAVRLYMNTWVIAPLERVQDWNKGKADFMTIQHMKSFRY